MCVGSTFVLFQYIFAVFSVSFTMCLSILSWTAIASFTLFILFLCSLVISFVFDLLRSRHSFLIIFCILLLCTDSCTNWLYPFLCTFSSTRLGSLLLHYFVRRCGPHPCEFAALQFCTCHIFILFIKKMHLPASLSTSFCHAFPSLAHPLFR